MHIQQFKGEMNHPGSEGLKNEILESYSTCISLQSAPSNSPEGVLVAPSVSLFSLFFHICVLVVFTEHNCHLAKGPASEYRRLQNFRQLSEPEYIGRNVWFDFFSFFKADAFLITEKRMTLCLSKSSDDHNNSHAVSGLGAANSSRLGRLQCSARLSPWWD